MEMSGNINNLSDQGAIAYLHAQEEIRKARATRRWITFGIVLGSMFVLMVGCGIAVGAAASGGSSSTGAVTPATTSAVGPGVTAPATEGSAPAPSAPVTAPLPESAPVAPAESDAAQSGIYGPGTYVVGRDLPAGDYWTPGSTTGHSGYASRMSGTTGDFGETLGVVSVPERGPAQITILASDHAVEFYGTDIVWTKV